MCIRDSITPAGSLSDTSDVRPALAVLNGRVYLAWKGDGNDNLNVSLVGIDRAGSITGFTTPDYLFEVQIPNFTVSPGDTVHCSVQYLANNTAGQISFGNSTNGENFQITLVPPPGATVSGNSAEWIMEVPGLGTSTGVVLAHLPNFTTVDFTNAVSCAPGVLGNPQNGGTFTIFDDGNNALTTTTLGNTTVAIKHA